MKKLVLPLALACALAACGGEPEEKSAATTDAAPAAAVTPAAPASPDRPDMRTRNPSTTGDAASVATDDATFAAKLDGILAAEHRAESSKRDQYRHPKETLLFFGLKPGQRVIEITPGAGWYTEILAPLMRGNGTFVAAVWDDMITGQSQYKYDLTNRYKTMLFQFPNLYDQAVLEPFTPPGELTLGEPGSADVVLTFRNVHNWLGDGSAPGIFKSAFDVLKPGGTLGVVEHRANAGTTEAQSKDSGYMTEEAVIKLATDAGFTLAEKSEINANPKDTKDHPKGVWTLPPSLALGDQDREKYVAIGESDRMTLRFTKPAAAQ